MRTTIDRVGGLYVMGDGSTGSGTLAASAGRDLKLLAGQVGNAGKDGVTLLQAGNNLNLGTVTTASSNSLHWDANNYRKDSTVTEVGSQVQASGAIVLKAGADINARAADVQAGRSLAVLAGHDINVVAGVNAATVDEGHQTSQKSLLHSELITTHDTLDRTSALGSSLGGTSVSLVAGNDIKVLGSTIAGDAAVSLTASNAISIAAVTETSQQDQARTVKESGFLSGGGFGISYGKRTTSTDQQQDASLQSGQARSQVGSVGGNLTLNAGAAISVAGSDLSAGQDISLAGKSVTITPGQDQLDGRFTSKTTQDGLTLAVGGSVVNAMQTMQSMGAAASQAKSGRVTAMAAATAAMAAKNAAADCAKDGVSVSVSLTAGHSESEQTRTTASTSHSGSTLAAGNNVAISASGGGKDSNITIVGSDIGAGNNVALRADNQVNLLAAQDLDSQHSQSKSLSAAAGVSAGYSSKGGLAVGVTGSLSASRGSENGEGSTQLNTHVNAGAQLAIASGGDTNLKGAVASGAQVVADVGGNLNIESLQDTAKFDSRNQSVNVSATLGYGASVSASANQSKIHSDYASVQERSGLQAGDGGFQVKVAGNTDLKGATIGSTAAGAAASSLTTATLTQSDIANHATMEASSVGRSGSATSGGSDDGKYNKDGGKGAGPGGTNLVNQGATGKSGGLPGVASTSESDASTTRSGIGAGALVITDDAAQRAATGKGAQDSVAATNRDVTTGVDRNSGIANSFDLQKVEATLAATAGFSAAAARAVGDYASDKLQEAKGLKEKAARETDSVQAAALAQQADELQNNWKEDGFARVALHTAVGDLAGGASGALGAGATALTTPAIAKEIAKLDVPEGVKSALTLAAGAAVGAAVGGETGAAAALNEVDNNYLKHKEVDKLLQAQAQCKSDPAACKVAEDLIKLSAERDKAIKNCDATANCTEWLAEVQKDSAGLSQSIKENDARRSKAYEQQQKAATAVPLLADLNYRGEVLRDQFSDMSNVNAMGGIANYLETRGLNIIRRIGMLASSPLIGSMGIIWPVSLLRVPHCWVALLQVQ